MVEHNNVARRLTRLEEELAEQSVEMEATMKALGVTLGTIISASTDAHIGLTIDQNARTEDALKRNRYTAAFLEALQEALSGDRREYP